MDPNLEREKSLDRQIRASHWVRLLEELPDRRAGRSGERESADRIEAWMRDVGAESVTRRAVSSRPSPAAGLALHMGLAAAGCALGGIPGFGIAALAALSFVRERGRGERWLGALLPQADSINCVGRAGAARPRRRLVLTAPLDAPSFGRPTWPSLDDLLSGRSDARLEALLLVAVLVAGASALDASGALFGITRTVVCAALLVPCLAAIDRVWSAASSGADHGAAAVASLLTCAEQLLPQLPGDVELWLLVTGGADAGASGMRAFLDGHPDFSQDGSWFVSFSDTGARSLHYARREGQGAEAVVHPPMLTELARRVTAGGVHGAVTPVDLGFATPARLSAERHHPTLSVVALDADGRPRRRGRIVDAPESLAQSLQMETVVRAGDFGAAVLAAALRGEADPLALV